MDTINQYKDILFLSLLIIIIFVLIKKEKPRIYLSLGLTVGSILLITIFLLMKNEYLANSIAYYTMIFLIVDFLLFLGMASKKD